MITRIEIDGFKSFADFSLGVPPFLLLVGANASGKSNLLDALRLTARAQPGDSSRTVLDTQLRQIPAYSAWLDELTQALKELHFL